MSLRRLLGIALLLALAARAEGQPPVGIRHAVYVAGSGPTPAHVEVVFQSSFGAEAAAVDAANRDRYRLVDLYGSPGGAYGPVELRIDRAVVPVLSGVASERLNTVQLLLASELPVAVDDRYVLIVSGLSIGETPAAVTSTPTPVTMKMAGAGLKPRHWAKAETRETADVYFQGAWSRSAGSDFHGSLDVKARYPTAVVAGKRTHWLTPTLDLAASADPDADPDSLVFGGAWQFFPVRRSGGSLPITRWENALEHEASRDFDYRTLVWRSELLLLPKAWRIGGAWFWVNPVAGIAAGRILEVPEQAFDSGGLFRLLAGVGATLEIAETFSIGGQYHVRRQFQDELAGQVTFGKGTHPWIVLTAALAFNDFISVGATYKNGELPPTYQRVRDSVTIDLTFKAARTR
jgi:hypothetical protein